MWTGLQMRYPFSQTNPVKWARSNRRVRSEEEGSDLLAKTQAVCVFMFSRVPPKFEMTNLGAFHEPCANGGTGPALVKAKQKISDQAIQPDRISFQNLPVMVANTLRPGFVQ
jgi:hypothetical protein